MNPSHKWVAWKMTKGAVKRKDLAAENQCRNVKKTKIKVPTHSKTPIPSAMAHVTLMPSISTNAKGSTVRGRLSQKLRIVHQGRGDCAVLIAELIHVLVSISNSVGTWKYHLTPITIKSEPIKAQFQGVSVVVE